MKNLRFIMKWPLLLTAMLGILMSGCKAQSTSPPVVYSIPELKYILITHFDDVFWTDPDFYPVAREGQEEKNALEQFSAIRSDSAEFTVILRHLTLPDKAEYTNEEKISIYREHKKLTYAVEITTVGDINRFTLRVGEDQGYLIEGTITSSGEIKVEKKEPSFNTHPICLAKGTLIDAPGGLVPVEQLYQGMAVWTIGETGKRTPAVVVEITATPVPASFQIIRVRLDDGRAVTASAGHPTAEGRVLGAYQQGDTLDGALVVTVEHLAYNGATYDLLSSGDTGLYWTNGILLKSTIATR